MGGIQEAPLEKGGKKKRNGNQKIITHLNKINHERNGEKSDS